MKRFGIAVLFAIVGYLVAAVASYFLVGLLSSNVHDRSVEAAMTSAFVFGPIGAVVAFVAGLIRGGRSAAKTQTGA
jgi:predicted membrane metal-binding protein